MNRRIIITCLRDAILAFRYRSLNRSAQVRRVAGHLAMEILAQVKFKWEAPIGRRRLWRRRKQDGTYEYREQPPEETKAPAKPVEQQEKKVPVKKEYKHHVVLGKDELKHTLSHGYFSIVSAGRNPNDKKEEKMKVDDEFFHKRHEELRDELEKHGLKYTEVIGHYGGKETSFLVLHEPEELTAKTVKSVMVHHKDQHEAERNRKIVQKLGKHFNQDSVLHGSSGKNTLQFTTGKNEGKECSGKGWKETPEAKDFYTEIKLEKKKHTKFNLDLSECFQKGYL